MPRKVVGSRQEGHGIARGSAVVEADPLSAGIRIEGEAEDLVLADGVESNVRGRSGQTSRGPSLPEPLPFSRKLADAPLNRIEGDEPVPDPSQRIEAPELARSRTFPTEGTHVRPVETEDADLVVYGVRHEDGLIGADGDGADLAELVGSLLFRQRPGSDRDDRG
ncbi:MAG: hypothetical protein OXR82_17335 [Gammaproteobacteria bacterium]|nr:hypothetical protein [Gammaproteobacteria bacterium]